MPTYHAARWVDAALAGGRSCVLAPYRLETETPQLRLGRKESVIKPTWPLPKRKQRIIELVRHPELYQEYGSLNPKDVDRVLRFVDEYGLPGSRHRPDLQPPTLPPVQSLSEIQNEIKRMALIRDSYMELEPLQKEAKDWADDSRWKDWKKYSWAHFRRITGELNRRLFGGQFGTVLQQVQPALEFSFEPPELGIVESWQVRPPYNPSLSEVMWLQLYRDIVDALPMRRCQNENCPRRPIFVRQLGRFDDPKFLRSDTKFCSHQCAKAVGERRRRKKKGAKK